MSVHLFPSRTIAWYMAKLFLIRTVAVLFAIVLVLQALDLLGESGKILKAGNNGQAEILTYISLRTPQIIARFLPFSVLLATIITMVTLNQHSEIISMKAAGLSAHQVLLPLIIASLGISLVSFAFNDRIVSRATSKLSRWQKSDYTQWPKDRSTFQDAWVRDGNNLIHAGTVTGYAKDAKLADVTIYVRDEAGLLKSYLRAKNGVQKDGGWLLTEVSTFDVNGDRVNNIPDVVIGEGIKPAQFTLIGVDPEAMSFRARGTAIVNLEAAGRPTQALVAARWHKISGPLSAVLMPLLAAVAAFGIARSGKLFVRSVIGMMLGFLYFVADNFGLAMGNMGAYPPLLAAWGPFFLFLFIGEFVLFKTEE